MNKKNMMQGLSCAVAALVGLVAGAQAGIRDHSSGAIRCPARSPA